MRTTYTIQLRATPTHHHDKTTTDHNNTKTTDDLKHKAKKDAAEKEKKGKDKAVTTWIKTPDHRDILIAAALGTQMAMETATAASRVHMSQFHLQF